MTFREYLTEGISVDTKLDLLLNIANDGEDYEQDALKILVLKYGKSTVKSGELDWNLGSLEDPEINKIYTQAKKNKDLKDRFLIKRS